MMIKNTFYQKCHMNRVVNLCFAFAVFYFFGSHHIHHLHNDGYDGDFFDNLLYVFSKDLS